MKFRLNIQWKLVLYDVIVFAFTCFLIYIFTSVSDNVGFQPALIQYLIALIILFDIRIVFKIYHHIWRFEGVSGYILLIISDTVASIINLLIQLCIPIYPHVAPTSFVVVFAINLLISLFMRMIYRYIYKNVTEETKFSKLYKILLRIFAGKNISLSKVNDTNIINIAIAGAGRTGTALYESIKSNPASIYKVMFFIDNDASKHGKIIDNIRVYNTKNNLRKLFNVFDVQEIVIAIPELHNNERKEMFEFYKKYNVKVKMFDYSSAVPASPLNQIRDFDIEDILPRKIKKFDSSKFCHFFNNKIILITGAGGSIGSELSRQIANMQPKQLILLDIYENGVYDLQQDLILKYKDKLNLSVEIATITNNMLIDKIFNKYHPNIIIHAAAHKHVPLMENDPIEAITNNIFGTKNLIDASEKYKVDKFMMVSTDKAVNPTNIMGATKRFCEIMVIYASLNGKVSYGSTRFGNVLGSAGSVVPLFKRQIANGGPITITDKNIVRYFMTIPEACNLVLHATAMTNNGELFVLDMGQQVKIYDLAKNLIKVSGVPNIKIVETGLRPGEKLYEEILINKDKHNKTENELIFIEKNTAEVLPNNFESLLEQLNQSCKNYDIEKAKAILKEVIPEYKDNKEVNAAALKKLKK